MTFDSMFSKLAAGGLSAGVFLFWWPHHVMGDGLLQLIVRGLLWTLTFELLLMAFAPLERLVRDRLKGRGRARGLRLRERIEAAPTATRVGGAFALACAGLAIPVALLADTPGKQVKAEVRPQVVKQVIVERPVIKREVVVRRVMESGGLPGAPAAAPERTATTSSKKSSSAAGGEKRSTPSKPSSSGERTATTKPPATKESAPATTAPAPQTTTAPAPEQDAAPAPAPAAPQAEPQTG